MTFDIPTPGLHYLKVAPLEPEGPWPDDTRYSVLYDVQEPSNR